MQIIARSRKNGRVAFLKRIIVISIISIFLSSAVCAQQNKRYVRNPEKDLFGKSLNNKREKIREPRGVKRAKKKQAKAEKRQDRQYSAYVKRNRSHALEIQSPEVRERMKQNRKEADSNYNVKKKRVKENSKKAGRKYK